MSMKGMLCTIVSMFGDVLDTFDVRRDQLRQRWRESRSLPRKKKKLARKHIQLDWSLNEWQAKMFNL
jgi:hypothetical protein